ncbi:hypothetical protein RJ639_019981 [Escallonia herrerae]|uniref:tRNA (guanine(26)-N(2))-dimethyltransferase n=1 Tax=Escallonia herrerae TaxID=1293975 RepID=A0AA88VAL5_9ASTE|nr:hypothetical protein RJ639_019981 [Escallonia herrerae]
MISLPPYITSPLYPNKPQNPNNLRKTRPPAPPVSNSDHYHTERGLQFDAGDTFFRRESATGRDLGVLAAALHKKTHHSLRVLDALCGCGIRSLRYLIEADADFVWANDANENHGNVILSNLSQVSRGFGENRRWVVTHCDANAVMADSFVHKEYFDFIDVDSFGSDSSFLRAAFNALRFGGLLYLTSTDGYTSGGHRPQHCLAAYGAYLRPMPYSNELGLRMLIAGAVREASVLGYHVVPLFSYYSYHGPVFRVLLQVKRGKLPNNSLGDCTLIQLFLTVTTVLLATAINVGIHKRFHGTDLVPGSLVVSGPLYTGPLHSATYLAEMLNLAEQWGWTGNGTGKDLEKLLKQLIDESDPKLPFGFIKLDELASRAKIDSPPLLTMMSALHKVPSQMYWNFCFLSAEISHKTLSECMKLSTMDTEIIEEAGPTRSNRNQAVKAQV